MIIMRVYLFDFLISVSINGKWATSSGDKKVDDTCDSICTSYTRSLWTESNKLIADVVFLVYLLHKILNRSPFTQSKSNIWTFLKRSRKLSHNEDNIYRVLHKIIIFILGCVRFYRIFFTKKEPSRLLVNFSLSIWISTW